MAKIALQLHGHEASSKAMDDLNAAKANMELKKIDDSHSEECWVDGMKEFALGCCRSVKKQEG
ncbi:unnamed protein product [Symbiodinium sp. KB8]|nr:unnamed protein product [Symbiodinium sp. KB8]